MKYFLILFFGAFGSLATAAPHVQWQPLNEPGSGGWLTALAVDPASSDHVMVGGDMLGVGASTNGGKKWDPTFGFLSYEIANFTFNPKKPSQIWVGTMSGPHVSNDGGIHWESKRNGLPPVSDNSYSAPIQQVLIDPDNDQRLLAFGGSWRDWTSPGTSQFGWVWESTDGGESWHEYSTVKRYRNIRWIAVAAGGFKTFYASVKSRGLYKSDDGAKTWTLIGDGLPSKNINQIATHPTDPKVLWVSLGCFQRDGSDQFQPGGVWKSTDAGATWTACNRGLPQNSSSNFNFTSNFAPISVSQSNPDVLYTSDTVWDNPAVYRSDNGGDSWQAVFTRDIRKGTPTAYPAGIGATVITVDPKNPDCVYCGGSETVIKSTDGGKTWIDLTAEAVQTNANGPALFRGRGYSGLCSLAVRFNPMNPSVSAIVGMDAGRLWISEDNQKTWRYCDNGFPWSWGGGRDVVFGGTDGKTLLGAFGQSGGSGNVGLSTDGGYTWEMLGKNGRGLPPSGQGMATGVYLLPGNVSQMWVVYNGSLYHSENGGRDWSITLNGRFGEIVADPKNEKAFYLTGDDGVQKTTDGKNFTALPDGPKPVTALVIDHQNPDVLYATQGYNAGGGIWKFDGKAWSKILDNSFISGLAIDPTDGNRIAASTNRDPYKDVCDATGAWLSDDGGKTWSNQSEGLACLRGWGIDINPNDPEQIYYCTQGRGFFVGHWPKPSTSTAGLKP